MTKIEIINKLNETDDYRALGFESVSDDGRNSLLVRKCGRGFMQLNRFENWYDEREDGEKPIYSDDVEGWNSGR